MHRRIPLAGVLALVFVLTAQGGLAEGASRSRDRTSRAPSQISSEALAAARRVMEARHATQKPHGEIQEFARVLRETESLLFRLASPGPGSASEAGQLAEERAELERLVEKARRGRTRVAAPFEERCERLFAALDTILETSDPVERAKRASGLLAEIQEGRPDRAIGKPTLRGVSAEEIERIRNSLVVK